MQQITFCKTGKYASLLWKLPSVLWLDSSSERECKTDWYWKENCDWKFCLEKLRNREGAHNFRLAKTHLFPLLFEQSDGLTVTMSLIEKEGKKGCHSQIGFITEELILKYTISWLKLVKLQPN